MGLDAGRRSSSIWNINLNTACIEYGMQRDTLTELKCDSAQGYLMSYPLSGEAARQFIDDLAAVPLASHLTR